MNRVLGALRRRWPIILVLIIVGGLVGGYLGNRVAVRYQATATVFFSLDRGASVSEFTAGTTYAQDLVPSYARVATMPIVLDPVISRLGLTVSAAALARQVTATAAADTVLLDIVVTDPVPATAAAIANAIGDELATQVTSLSPRGAPDAPKIRATTTSPAVPSSVPSSTDRRLPLVAGLVVGLLLGLLAAALLELVARPVVTRDEVADVTDAPVLGRIARDRRGRRRPVPVGSDPHLPRSEGYAILRTNLAAEFEGPGARSVAITSPRAGDGRTATAVNLAVSVANVGRRVVLVDADMRAPGVAAILGIESGRGLSDLLRGTAGLEAVLRRQTPQRPGAAPYDVVTAGALPDNPGELLASPAMRTLLDTLRKRYDLVVVDTPPLLPAADATVVAGQVGAALLVLDSRRTRRRHLAEAVDRLELAGTERIGIVLNNTRGGRGRAGRRATPDDTPQTPSRPAPVEPAQEVGADEATVIVPHVTAAT